MSLHLEPSPTILVCNTLDSFEGGVVWVQMEPITDSPGVVPIVAVSSLCSGPVGLQTALVVPDYGPLACLSLLSSGPTIPVVWD